MARAKLEVASELPKEGENKANGVAEAALRAIAAIGTRKRDASGRPIAYRPDPEAMAAIARDALEALG